MKILISIKKQWLKHRVYKYTLEYENELSKSKNYHELAKKFSSMAIEASEELGKFCSEVVMYNKISTEFQIKSEHSQTLSNIYLDKKTNLEKALNSLCCCKAE